MTAQPSTTRDDWDAAIKAHEDARAVTAAAEALDDASDPDGGIWNAAYWAENEALRAVMFMRAPDPAAMAEKARRGINHAYVELRGESADDADTLERMLSDGPWDEGCVVAALYQDALALSGDTGPLSVVAVSAFDGPDWIAATVASTGASMAGMVDDWGVAFTGTAEQVAAARTAFDGLKHWQREAVVRSLNL